MARTSDYSELLLARMAGDRPPEGFESDGCTNSPDSFGDIDISCACHYHDWHYSRGGNESDRAIADRRFRYNIHECVSFFEDIDDVSGPAHLAANIYFRRVRLWGVNFFRYDPPRGRQKKLWYMVRGFVRRWFE